MRSRCGPGLAGVLLECCCGLPRVRLLLGPCRHLTGRKVLQRGRREQALGPWHFECRRREWLLQPSTSWWCSSSRSRGVLSLAARLSRWWLVAPGASSPWWSLGGLSLFLFLLLLLSPLCLSSLSLSFSLSSLFLPLCLPLSPLLSSPSLVGGGCSGRFRFVRSRLWPVAVDGGWWSIVAPKGTGPMFVGLLLTRFAARSDAREYQRRLWRPALN